MMNQPNEVRDHGLPAAARNHRSRPGKPGLWLILLLLAVFSLAAQAANSGPSVPPPAARAEYEYWRQRAFPAGYAPYAPAVARARAAQFRAEYDRRAAGSNLTAAGSIANGPWSELGPRGLRHSNSAGLDAGRVLALLLQTGTPNRIVVGTGSGGIWRRAITAGPFTPESDFAPSMTVGAFAADPNNAGILYAGTGEPGISVNAFAGNGLLRSTDGGDTWTRADSGVFTGKTITRLWVDPRNSARLLASVLGDGLYESTNSGAAWTLRRAGGGMGFAVSPTDPDRILFSDTLPAGTTTGDLLLSTNGGTSFTAVNGPWQGTGTAVGRIDLQFAPSDAAIVWASVAPPTTGTDNGQSGIYRSTDGGATFQVVLANNPQGASAHANAIAVAPNDPTVFYCGGVNLFRGQFGGNFTRLTHPDGSTALPYVHSGQHAIVINPVTPTTLYACNDGGVYISTDSGNNWTDLNAGLGNIQFYAGCVGVDDGLASLIGGAQDNGTERPTNGLEWTETLDGNGFQCAVDPGQAGVVYATREDSNYYISNDFGRNFVKLPDLPFLANEETPYITPIAIDPSNGTRVFGGAERVYLGISNRVNSVSWTPLSNQPLFPNETIHRIAVAPTDGSVIYASGGAFLSRTTTANDPWTRIDPPGGQFITGVAVHPTNSNYVVCSRSGFTNGHVVRSTNGGSTWTDITTNLPNVPANNILLRVTGARLDAYLATDTGVYCADLNAATVSWAPVGTGLPNAPVFDVLLAEAGARLIAVTHGRGMWSLSSSGVGLVVVSPNGGEFFNPGEVRTLQWNGPGVTGNVRIELSRNGGGSWETLFPDTPNDGSQDWVVTGPATTQARIRVTSVSDATLQDISDANFTITNTFFISGRITANGGGVPGVTVTAGGATATTDASGNYTLTGLAAGTYTVTPSRTGFTFTPTNRTVTVGPSATGVDFTAAVPTYDIRGRVTLNGVGLPGVFLSIGARQATTDANGDYAFLDVPAGNYTVTPNRSGFVFTPTSRTVTLNADANNVSFTATEIFTISGRITEGAVPLSGVTVTAGTASATTNAAGDYTLEGLLAGTYTVTPSRVGYRFTPESAAVTVGPSRSGVNFSAVRAYSISGRVTEATQGLDGVTISAGARSTVTAPDGTYTLDGLPAGTYTLVPELDGFGFTPQSRTVTVGPSQASINFTAQRSYFIRGTITDGSQGLEGVSVKAGSASTLTTADGSYELQVTNAGVYNVIPRLDGYAFTPALRQVTVGPDDAESVNFTGTNGFTVRGRVTRQGAGLQGVTVSTGDRTATTGPDGSYQLSGLAPGSYTLTPSLIGYSFTPASRSVTVDGDETGVDFTAADVPVLQSFTVVTSAVRGKKPLRGSVTLSQTVRTPTTVTLTSSDPTIIVVPAKGVKVAKNRSSVKFSLKTRKVTAPVQVVLTASLGGVTRQVFVTVTP